MAWVLAFPRWESTLCVGWWCGGRDVCLVVVGLFSTRRLQSVGTVRFAKEKASGKRVVVNRLGVWG